MCYLDNPIHASYLLPVRTCQILQSRLLQVDSHPSHPCGLLDPLIHFEGQENLHLPRILILLSSDIPIFEYRCPFKAHTSVILGFNYFCIIYKDSCPFVMFKKVSLKLILPSLLILGIVRCVIHNNISEEYQFVWDISIENHTGISKDLHQKDGKHRGMSVFGWQRNHNESINQLVKNNIEWVAIVPFLYQKTEKTTVVRLRKEYDNWSRSDSTYLSSVEKIHARKMHVMLKPHLWMNEGWRSNIQMDNTEEWNVWFESYRKEMVHYAKLANHAKIELFCIGTELKSSLIAQPEKWNTLIKEIKDVYFGRLTYAANWDGEFNDVKFWDQMDYIGIQAYFPITNKNNPSLNEIKKGWKKQIKLLEALSKKHNKPILFSETGYRSDETATIEPWIWGSALDIVTNKKSFETQNLAYEALFQQLWDKDWFAGLYFWQWHVDSVEGSNYEKMDFTPRFKPAENTMAKWYGRE